MSFPKLKVVFKEDALVYDHNGKLESSFKAKEVYELSAPSAKRWVRRNKAEYYAPPPAVETKEEKPQLTSTPRRKRRNALKHSDATNAGRGIDRGSKDSSADSS